jgi:DNA topoisomerase-1
MPRLRRSDTSAAGLRRVPRGRGFQHLAAAGSRPDPADLDRIRQLVIPPAWTDVWICPHPSGHLQATGVDAAGRRQYLYHAEWRARRDRKKHDHVLAVTASLPAAREIASTQLASRALSRERVLAAAFTLLDVGLFGIGGDRYAEQNGSYGLMTLRREHVHCT